MGNTGAHRPGRLFDSMIALGQQPGAHDGTFREIEDVALVANSHGDAATIDRLEDATVEGIAELIDMLLAGGHIFRHDSARCGIVRQHRTQEVNAQEANGGVVKYYRLTGF